MKGQEGVLILVTASWRGFFSGKEEVASTGDKSSNWTRDSSNPALPKSDLLATYSFSMLIPLICEICVICVRPFAPALKPRQAPSPPQIQNYLDSHSPALFISFICDNAGITKIVRGGSRSLLPAFQRISQHFNPNNAVGFSQSPFWD